MLQNFLNTLWNLTNEMSPYLLLGFFIAGILHAFMPKKLYSRHLHKPNFSSVVKVAIFGIPLPLCSCGVIPTAMSLRKEGASEGATVSFLIATPQTGVDSIAATYSMLGLPFAIIRPIVALSTSLFGGVLANKFSKKDNSKSYNVISNCSYNTANEKKSFWQKSIIALKYGFVDMVEDLGRWLVIGLILATLITMFVPDDFFTRFNDTPLLSMLLVLLLSVPMYLCATGSIPIALALMIKGLSPGAALVLLMAGPATNIASIFVIYKVMGQRSTILYLLAIISGAIIFGLGVDYILPRNWFAINDAVIGSCHSSHPSHWLSVCSSIALTLMLIFGISKRYISSKSQTNNTNMKKFKITGMMCNHCKANVEKNIMAIDGVKSVIVDLTLGTAEVDGNVNAGVIIDTIKSLGYDCCEA
ncbi:MAG: SO_0444 family Cu/Zn efflux transporter [Muribaculaceae bacterium]|nr:SO_0444 family Cu/Zn efflux transporter [Muribaculaceae bacterium]